jgi:hypothetical protein
MFPFCSQAICDEWSHFVAEAIPSAARAMGADATKIAA